MVVAQFQSPRRGYLDPASLCPGRGTGVPAES
jgi:hypothetical protein